VLWWKLFFRRRNGGGLFVLGGGGGIYRLLCCSEIHKTVSQNCKKRFTARCTEHTAGHDALSTPLSTLLSLPGEVVCTDRETSPWKPSPLLCD
jgi:hypothetical protein